MKCPLLKIARAGLESEAARPLDDCLKENCAWWDKVGKSCIIQTAGYFLGTLCDQLTELIQRMPDKGIR